MRLRKRPTDYSSILSSTNRSMASSILASSTSRLRPQLLSMKLLRRRLPRTTVIFLKSENALWISLRSLTEAKQAMGKGEKRERTTKSSGRVPRMSKSYQQSSQLISPHPVTSSTTKLRLRQTQWKEEQHNNENNESKKRYLIMPLTI